MTSAFVPFRGRSEPAIGMRCRVYRNLNAPGYFSIQADEGPDKGRVLGRAKAIILNNVVFKVNRGGYQRCVSRGIRNVHAVAIGNYAGSDDTPPFDESLAGDRITYQPFVRPFFSKRSAPEIPVTEYPKVCAYEADLLCLKECPLPRSAVS